VGKTTQEPRHRINAIIQSTCTSFTASITCFVTPEITDDMPNIPLRRKDFEIPVGIKLADPYFAKTRSVDLLISAGLFWKLLCQLHDDVARFWEIENIFSRKPYPDLDSQNDCEQHFQATTERDHDGRFVVSLPLKSKVSELGNSLDIAQKRLISIERKLSKQPVLKESYIEFMDDYEAQGHMEKVPPKQINSHGPIFYLPHHAVFKESSTTTKVRVVFDGSAKTSSGLSLNDVQSVGPVIQSDLFSILLRFRQHRIVLSADITQ
ncbi:uncharacterized protein LOC117182505, partial [Belonocnema kinseyi]|uniref:uncharacterized protein LOC117182505 n=1 Tax=Belonocnema kinseyi TaxID=2817044 RepID=UPI00143D60ED